MSSSLTIFDRDLLARRRDRAAAQALTHDFLLHRVAEEMAERLDAIRRSFVRVLEVGAYHGVVGARLRQRAGVELLVQTDLSQRLIRKAPGLAVVADEEAVPFRAGAFDLVVSALSLHLVNDLPGTLAQLARVLRPDGLLLASMLGGATLTELRSAFLAAESELTGGASPRVAPVADVRDLGSLLQRAGLALPVVDAETVTVTYADPLALVREIKAMGASNMLVERRRVPMTRQLMFRALQIYRERFSGPDGRVPATFEIITMTAWSPDASQQKPLRPGSATARLADALGVTEERLKRNE